MSREERKKVYKEGYEQGRFDERMDSIDNRPPTEQEVCEALSEYLDRDVYYNKTSKRFIDKIGKHTWATITSFTNDNFLKILIYLPISLVNMISKFYEKESEASK